MLKGHFKQGNHPPPPKKNHENVKKKNLKPFDSMRAEIATSAEDMHIRSLTFLPTPQTQVLILGFQIHFRELASSRR